MIDNPLPLMIAAPIIAFFVVFFTLLAIGDFNTEPKPVAYTCPEGMVLMVSGRGGAVTRWCQVGSFPTPVYEKP